MSSALKSKAVIPINLEAGLKGLAKLNIEGLRATWTLWLGDQPPRCQSKDLLRYLLAWRAQEQRYGGLSLEVKRRLKELMASVHKGSEAVLPATSLLRAGTVISREWRGSVHRVHVLEDGFAYDGKRFASLSVIARSITGTRWSGPRFFGVEAKKPKSKAA